MALTRADLIDGFAAAGIQPGEVILVHSAFKSLGSVDGGPAALRDALLELLGHEGTLIAPTFNFAFCQGEPFDARTTPSQMGAFTEVVRTDPRATRVPHPIYSFAVIGARAGDCAAIDEPSSYGRHSLFGRLREWDGKIVVIGLSYNDSMTFFHHVEEIEGCDYRYMKTFTGRVTDVHGVTEERVVTMLVRDLERGVVTAVDQMGEVLEQEGVARVTQVGSARVVVMDAREVYDSTARHLADGGRLLYVIAP